MLKNEDNIKRILHVVSAMNRGGAETMIMNLYRKIDRKKIQFDFIVHSNTKGHYDDEIVSLGGRIIKCNSLGTVGPVKYIRELSRLISNNGPFHAVHSHTDFQGGFVAMAAKKADVDKRICHSHNTQWVANPSIIHKIQLAIFKEMIDRYASDYCACGIDSAKFLFKENKIKENKIKYLNNGIDIEKFNNDYNCSHIKSQFDICEDTIVIGHIGRFYEQKNHKFIIKLANRMKEKGYKFKILLVGEGPLLDKIKSEVEILNLNQYVKFLGIRSDIAELMNVFDVFLFPSFFEGLPVVLVEAQASGLPCVISDTITKEIDFKLDLIKYSNLNESIDTWIDQILSSKYSIKVNSEKINSTLSELGYDVNSNIDKIMKLYKI